MVGRKEHPEGREEAASRSARAPASRRRAARAERRRTDRLRPRPRSRRTEGYNLSVITLPKPKNGTASTGPIVGRATGADNGTVPTGPIVEESAKEQWGLVPARNGAIPRRVMGPPLLAPTEGYRGNQKGGRAPAADETDVVALRAHRLAALTPCDDAAALITARRVVELCTELGATLRQIDAVLAEHERDEDGMDDPIDLLFELGAIDLDTMARHPAYRTLAKEGVALAIIDNSRGHWLDNAPRVRDPATRRASRRGRPRTPRGDRGGDPGRPTPRQPEPRHADRPRCLRARRARTPEARPPQPRPHHRHPSTNPG